MSDSFAGVPLHGHRARPVHEHADHALSSRTPEGEGVRAGLGDSGAVEQGVVPGQSAFVHLPADRPMVWVPTSRRAAALSGLCLYPASRRRRIVAQHLLWTAVRAVGPGLLRGPRQQWHPPTSRDQWQVLESAWREAAGPFDSAAIYERPQVSRPGVALLLLNEGRQVAFVKLRQQPEPLLTERVVLDAFRGQQDLWFQAPETMGHGEVDGWHWLAMSTLPARPHRPKKGVDLVRVTREISGVLSDVLPPAPAGSDRWAPMHGDLAPWNLRGVRGERPWLLDWEDSGWGPPDADEVYHRAVVAAVTGRRPGVGPREAVDFWLARVDERSPADSDAQFNHRLRLALRRMVQA